MFILLSSILLLGSVASHAEPPVSMVRGRVADSARFEGLHPRFAAAFRFLREHDLATLAPGRYAIAGDDVYANVSDVTLKPWSEEAPLEVHRDFIDIQVPVTGPETMGYVRDVANVARHAAAFNVKDDYVLFKNPAMAKLTFAPGEFVVYFPPYGAHAPGRTSATNAVPQRKVVVKVRADALGLGPRSHPWARRTVAFLGDSITDPCHVGCKTNYWGFLSAEIGVVPYVYGINGRRWNSVIEQGEKLKAERPDIDAILIFMGTNDYNGGVPLGTWYDLVNEPANRNGVTVSHLRRRLSTDGSTLRGNINRAMAYLKHNFPDAQIVILTPIHRGFAAFGKTNVQPDESYANALGLFISDYVAVMREIGAVWSVPVIDLFADAGLYPCDSAYAKYFHKPDTDILHPNDRGHRRIADTIAARLSALPIGFAR